MTRIDEIGTMKNQKMHIFTSNNWTWFTELETKQMISLLLDRLHSSIEMQKKKYE